MGGLDGRCREGVETAEIVSVMMMICNMTLLIPQHTTQLNILNKQPLGFSRK